MVGSLPDVITYAKFQLKFLGVTVLQGIEFPIFLLIFEWALQQCSATALPVSNKIKQHQKSEKKHRNAHSTKLRTKYQN